MKTLNKTMNIAIVGPNGCGKTEALEKALPSLNQGDFYDHHAHGYNIHSLLIGTTHVTLYDILGAGLSDSLLSVYSELDGVIIFPSPTMSINYTTLIRKVSPDVLIRYFHHGEDLESHIYTLMRYILVPENKSNITPQVQASQEMFLLATTDPGEAYLTMAEVHDAISRLFIKQVKHGDLTYYNFSTPSNMNHMFKTQAACIAYIIEHAHVRIEKATLYE